MAPLKSTMKKQGYFKYVSIGKLNENQKYRITKFESKQTKYGPSITCKILSMDKQKLLVYLPKNISLTEKEITKYNNGSKKNLHLVYKGKNENAFIIDFE